MGVRKKISQLGAEQARSQLPQVLDDANRGLVTIVTKHRKPYAAVVPVAQVASPTFPRGLLSLHGTGTGLWGARSCAFIDSLRDEWQ